MTIAELFTDQQTVSRIQTRLPQLFQIAEVESSRAGKIGMEVGSVREKIIIALLIYKFGEVNIETGIPITEPEIDVKAFGNPISIKTITGKKLNGVKLIWTVDAEQAFKFSQEYIPRCDIILIQVNWNHLGNFYWFPRSAQVDILQRIGRQNYIRLPKVGTNPRGIEISSQALEMLSKHNQSRNILIEWNRKAVSYDPYERWLEFWSRE